MGVHLGSNIKTQYVGGERVSRDEREDAQRQRVPSRREWAWLDYDIPALLSEAAASSSL